MNNNKKLIHVGFILWLLMTAGNGYGQVTWDFSAVKKSDHLVEVHLKALLSEGWHLYPTDSASSPFPTKIDFLPGPGFSLKGALREKGELTTYYQKDSGGSIRYFTGAVEFIQEVSVGSNGHSAQGTVRFVVCTDEECMPPETKDFAITW
jgi:hypothetical protein